MDGSDRLTVKIRRGAQIHATEMIQAPILIKDRGLN